MSYELIKKSLGADECRELAKLIDQQLGTAQHTGPYMVTDPERTQALLRPRLFRVFPGDWTYAACVVLNSGGSLSAHTDGENGLYRQHLVLRTNPGVWMFHGGDWHQLEVGCRYRMDPMHPHGAVNWGGESRIHLLVDRQLKGE